MDPNAIEVEHVTKAFKLYRDKAQSAKERVIKLGRMPYEEFKALDDVSFEVAQGETVGLLGHNGSGKSTMLKCITGTLRPTSGRIRTLGRTAALLELGAGFHPDLTGRENVYLNGSILGLDRHYIDRVFDDIVDFSEIGAFIDNQVKHYSSGMYSRLGFAVAVNVDPDVLLVDEVLSVGDEAFQRKCLDRVKQFQREGRSILLVSHSADLMRQTCDRVVVLDHGRVVSSGEPGQAIRDFRDTLLAGGLAQTNEVDVAANRPPPPTKEMWFTEILIEYPGGSDQCHPDDPVRVQLRDPRRRVRARRRPRRGHVRLRAAAAARRHLHDVVRPHDARQRPHLRPPRRPGLPQGREPHQVDRRGQHPDGDPPAIGLAPPR
jgi:ABC-type polysaccharide/polyol phosphate transport system ATPase subunit